MQENKGCLRFQAAGREAGVGPGEGRQALQGPSLGWGSGGQRQVSVQMQSVSGNLLLPD